MTKTCRSTVNKSANAVSYLDPRSSSNHADPGHFPLFAVDQRHPKDQQESVPSFHVTLERYMASPHAITVRHAVKTAVHPYHKVSVSILRRAGAQLITIVHHLTAYPSIVPCECVHPQQGETIFNFPS
ncbi:hypothetical protein EV702DRAFT_1046660 [Suillus placidus]|uniref:Uncharacterized protein n=1 Tax=Suillus placidus TaxID=48579 RepID=A0A9P6ZTW2_9AGAM|nr:hypothetical protein EV702DRAFT_1046660 [Suillus placidus]